MIVLNRILKNGKLWLVRLDGDAEGRNKEYWISALISTYDLILGTVIERR